MIAELGQYLKVDGGRVRVIERACSERSSFWTKLTELAPWLEVEHVRDPELRVRETKLSGAGEHGPISFVGDIELPQLGPLVETLCALSTGRLEWESPATRAELLALDRGVELDVIVSPLCPFCATVTAAALRFAAVSPKVAARIQRSDAIRLPDFVHTLPTVLADGEVVARGAVNEYTLVRQVFVYQRSMPPASGVNFTMPEMPGLKSAGRAAREPAPNRRPRRPTAA